jgi:hypothetical protein
MRSRFPEMIQKWVAKDMYVEIQDVRLRQICASVRNRSPFRADLSSLSEPDPLLSDVVDGVDAREEGVADEIRGRELVAAEDGADAVLRALGDLAERELGGRDREVPASEVEGDGRDGVAGNEVIAVVTGAVNRVHGLAKRGEGEGKNELVDVRLIRRKAYRTDLGSRDGSVERGDGGLRTVDESGSGVDDGRVSVRADRLSVNLDTTEGDRPVCSLGDRSVGDGAGVLGRVDASEVCKRERSEMFVSGLENDVSEGERKKQKKTYTAPIQTVRGRTRRRERRPCPGR